MIHFSLNLPAKYRLETKIVKSRKNLDVNPILPSLGKIRRSKNGSKISRYFTHIFEHNKIRQIFGLYLFLFLLVSSFLPKTGGAYFEDPEFHASSVQILKTEKGVRYPVDKVKVTQGFGLFHGGIDLDGVTGDKVFPIMAGKIEDIQHSKFGYGNSITINHGNGVTSLYAHLSIINVEKGQTVSKESILGKIGKTGQASGDHLHLEIRENGKTVNPNSILK